MAKVDCKSNSVVHQTIRYSTVGYTPDPARPTYPQIKVKGKWLTDAGFVIGMPLAVRVMDSCLVIIPKEPIPELHTRLKPVELLSEKSLQELDQVIKGLLLRDKIVKRDK